ncbi:hypothetical protein ACLEPN_23940 [Myxococcus sp. 1LA]
MAYRDEDVDAALQGLPEQLRAILQKLFKRNPSERFASADELEKALRARMAELLPYGPHDAVMEVENALCDAGEAMEELDLGDDEGGFVPAGLRMRPDNADTLPEPRNEDEVTTSPRPEPRPAVKPPTV